MIRELRAGFRLRKVEDTNDNGPRSPGVYELTPYEMLMEDIRLRRFALRNTPMVSFTLIPGRYLESGIRKFVQSRQSSKVSFGFAFFEDFRI